MLPNGPTQPLGLPSREPAVKVAGSRRKKPASQAIQKIGKGKKPMDGAKGDTVGQARRGRPAGASNFSEADTWALLNATADEKPIGERGWRVVHNKYNEYARRHGRPVRTAKSLENKFKQVRRFVYLSHRN